MTHKEFLEEAKPPFAAYIVENNWMHISIMEKGWGNGYIVIPHDHPWYLWIKKSNEEHVPHVWDETTEIGALMAKLPDRHNSVYDGYQIGIDVHGGATFGKEVKEVNEAIEVMADDTSEEEIKIDGYVIGFDTMHYQDDMERWSKENVKHETLALLKLAVDSYKPGVIAEVLPDYINS